MQQTFFQEIASYDSIWKFKLISFYYWSLRYNIRWESGNFLFICGFLLKLPPFFWIAPYPPTYDVGYWSTSFHPEKVISNLKQVVHTRDVQFGEMVRRSNKLRNPNVSYYRYIMLPFRKWRWNFTQDMRCSDIAFVALRSTPIPLLHPLISTKPKRVYKSHYELFLLPHPQLGLHQGLFLQLLLCQNLRNAKLLLLLMVHLVPLDNWT